MSRLDDAAEIVALAEDLRLGSPAKPVEAIVGLCLRKLDSWVAQAGGVTGIAALEALVTQRLQMVFEEILSDADGERDAANREDLSLWSDSKGKRLEGRAVAVEARKVADRVIAIVQPVEPVRTKPQRARTKGLFEE